MIPLRLPGSLLLLAALTLGSLPGCGGGRDVVDGFHGYRWGTRVSQIPEVALAGLTREEDGLLVYSAPVRFLGREVLGIFYFDSDGGGLLEGRYVLPLSLQECDGEWDRVAESLRSAFPTLRWTEEVPTRGEGDRGVYESDCEFFVYNSHRLEWEALLENPEPPGDAILLELEPVGRSVRLAVTYRGGAAVGRGDQGAPGGGGAGPD